MKSGPPGSRLVPYIPLVLFIGIGMFLVWYSTVWGAGLISDSFQYTASARSLALRATAFPCLTARESCSR